MQQEILGTYKNDFFKAKLDEIYIRVDDRKKIMTDKKKRPLTAAWGNHSTIKTMVVILISYARSPRIRRAS